MRRAALLALAAMATAVGAMPLLSPHHFSVGVGVPVADRILLSGALLDPADPGDADAISLEMVGDVVATGLLDHAGYTLCWGVCTMTPPARSQTLFVRDDSRIRVNGDWALPVGMAIDIRADAQVVVVGTLTAPAGGQSINVSGSPAILPAPIISAEVFSGTFTAGVLPAGTELAFTSTTITLVATP